MTNVLDRRLTGESWINYGKLGVLGCEFKKIDELTFVRCAICRYRLRVQQDHLSDDPRLQEKPYNWAIVFLGSNISTREIITIYLRTHSIDNYEVEMTTNRQPSKDAYSPTPERYLLSDTAIKDLL